jgi:hypothetical protein
MLMKIDELQPVSTMRLGIKSRNFGMLLALEENGLIAQGKTSLLGKLWSLTSAGRVCLSRPYVTHNEKGKTMNPFFDEKVSQVSTGNVVAFGIPLMSRYSKANELAEMLLFARIIALAGLEK